MWACHTGCEAFEKRLSYLVTVIVLAQNLLLLLKGCIATMCSLAIS